MRRPVAVGTLAVALLGCSDGSKLPKELIFGGKRFEKAAGGSVGNASSVVFIPPGEKFKTASLQIGILVSQEHKTGRDLNFWVGEQFRKSGTQIWHESIRDEEACKAGIPPGPVESITDMRFFLAVQICRTAPDGAACAEVDERLVGNDVERCVGRSSDCWEAMCTERWTQRRAELEAILQPILTK